MDHGESTRIGPSEPAQREPAAATANVRPFARLVRARTGRRPALSRLAMALVLVLSLATMLVFGLARVSHSVLAWLHGQPEYQQAWREIELAPAPPRWIKSGRAGLLERVRTQAGEPEWVSVLDLDLARIERDFKLHSPWVAGVDRVERTYPNRLVVRLRYREPVALVRRPDRDAIIIDKDAVILPAIDLERAFTGPLIAITSDKPRVNPPVNPRAGLVYSTGEQSQPDPDIAAAAKLAAFLKSHQAQPGSLPPRLRITVINPYYSGGLIAQTDDETLIVWGDAPGDEAPGSLTADEKWDLVRELFTTKGSTRVKYPDYLEFSQKRLRPRHREGVMAPGQGP